MLTYQRLFVQVVLGVRGMGSYVLCSVKGVHR